MRIMPSGKMWPFYFENVPLQLLLALKGIKFGMEEWRMVVKNLRVSVMTVSLNGMIRMFQSEAKYFCSR